MEIKKELVINTSTSRVFSAITDMRQLSKWFPDVMSIEPKVGGKITFKFFKSSSSKIPDIIEGKIIELEKNKKLVYTWSHPDVPDFPLTTVSWNLESLGNNKTRVVIIHAGFVDENTMNSYNKRWLWITDHLNTFAVSKKPVSIRDQIASTLIPGVDIWAFYRIKKLQKSTLYITTPVVIATILSVMVTFSNHNDFQNRIIGFEEYVQLQVFVTLGIIGFVISIMGITNYLMHKWTKEWNHQFLESPQKNRPIGIYVLGFFYLFDVTILVLFLGFSAEIPELPSLMAETPTMLDFVTDYAILSFVDWFVELSLIAIGLDLLIVIGLFFAKPNGRRLAIASGFGGIIFNVLLFGILGLIINGILLVYLFRSTAKESFQIRIS